MTKLKYIIEVFFTNSAYCQSAIFELQQGLLYKNKVNSILNATDLKVTESITNINSFSPNTFSVF